MPLPVNTGIPTINRLLASAAEPALEEGSGPLEAVGIVHDLLLGFDPVLKLLRPHLPAAPKGSRWKPAPLPSRDVYGVYSANTTALVKGFQALRALPVTGKVTHETLAALIKAKRAQVFITPAQLIFSQNFTYSAFLKAIVLTSGKECSFNFVVMNHNTDRAGLSLGVLHWAQKPGRLYEIIKFIREKNPAVVDALFGGSAQMDIVVAHLLLGAGALDDNGRSLDPTLEFAAPTLVAAIPRYWPECFRQLLLLDFAQQAMTEFALKTFRKLYDASYADYPGNAANLVGRNLKVYAPKLISERAVVFALDLINQHGGRTKEYYDAVLASNSAATEQEIMVGMRDEAAAYWLRPETAPRTPSRIPTPIPDGLKSKLQTKKQNAAADQRRRTFFLDTPQLSSAPFDPA